MLLLRRYDRYHYGVMRICFLIIIQIIVLCLSDIYVLLSDTGHLPGTLQGPCNRYLWLWRSVTSILAILHSLQSLIYNLFITNLRYDFEEWYL